MIHHTKMEQLKNEFARTKGFANWNTVWQHCKTFQAFELLENELILYINVNSPSSFRKEEIDCIKASLEKYERFCVDQLNGPNYLHPGARIRMKRRQECSDILWKRFSLMYSPGPEMVEPNSPEQGTPVAQRSVALLQELLQSGKLTEEQATTAKDILAQSQNEKLQNQAPESLLGKEI